ncbi:hypothetical protein GLAREA_06633 [Glarea lozoyensis ATCC 20868]|uniref:Uncharacterized protein n=1 Tax=Glarea lozoyensis (strain ATCC 20868 / MF5171) TaxID=1116229 RepID=S3D745_GLAL2|nr:uncharacterized protein GLAREA_06633 [Glarea lozoyensis ATCC 20868]EPE33620.1 hypothetical protein GLAREA_06633 [Glarea lozoyensis ATCC 20868]
MQSSELELCLICRKINTDPDRRPTVGLPFIICSECYTEHSSKLGHDNFDYFKDVAAITPLVIHDEPPAASPKTLAKEDESRQARATLECSDECSSGIDQGGNDELTLPIIDEEPFFVEFTDLLTKHDDSCQAGALLECDIDGSRDDQEKSDKIPRIEITLVDDDIDETTFEDFWIPMVDELDELQEISTVRPPTRRSEREDSPPSVVSETDSESGADGAVDVIALQNPAEDLDTVTQILVTHQPEVSVDYECRIAARYQSMLKEHRPQLKKKRGRASLKIGIPTPQSEEIVASEEPVPSETSLEALPQGKKPSSVSRSLPAKPIRPPLKKRSATSTSTQPNRPTTSTPTELKTLTLPPSKSPAVSPSTELKTPTSTPAPPKSPITSVRPTRAFTLRQQAAYLLQHADEPRGPKPVGPKPLKSSRLPRAKGRKKKIQFVKTNLGRIDEEVKEEVQMEVVEEEEERGRRRTRD